MNRYEQYKQAFAGQIMPFAFVDLDLLDRNCHALAQRAGGKRIRVASKSVRSVVMLRHILSAAPVYQGIMSFTVNEAVYLAEQGFDDLLVGYPCWHPDQVRAAIAQIRAGKRIVLMIDSVEHVHHLNAIAAQEQVVLPVCLDIDLSVDFPGLHFGVWRSSVFAVEDALRVYAELDRAKHLRLEGVMGYEAQIAGVGDRGPAIRSRLIRWLKAQSIPRIAERRRQIVEALTARGAALRFVNGGGTGSLESTAQESAVTELTAGSGFFSPGLFDHYQGFRHEPAAGFAIEVVRQPKPGIYTCLGGGYIASGGVGPEKQPVVYLPEGAALTDLEGAGEVQTPVMYRGQLQLGDPVFLRHSKAGELCERFNMLLLVRGGVVVDQVSTYRGDGHAFL